VSPIPTTVQRSSPVYGSVLPLLDAAVATGVEVVSLPVVTVAGAVAGAVAGVVLVAGGVVAGAEVVVGCVCVCVCVVEAWVVLPNGSVYC
jgi:hypothetical protein